MCLEVVLVVVGDFFGTLVVVVAVVVVAAAGTAVTLDKMDDFAVAVVVVVVVVVDCDLGLVWDEGVRPRDCLGFGFFPLAIAKTSISSSLNWVLNKSSISAWSIIGSF